MLTRTELSQLERDVIEAVLFYPETIFEISEIIEPDDLNDIHAKEIYEACLDFFKTGKKYDVVGIIDLISEGSRDYIYNRESTLTTRVKANSIAKKIKEYSTIRKTKDKLRVVLKDKTRSAGEIINEITEIGQELVDTKGGASIVDIMDTAEAIVQKNIHMGEIEGYSFGLPKLDKITAGIIPGATYVIGGLKKSGKSKFIINTIYHLHKQNIPSLFFSLEMGDQKVVRWLAARFSRRRISTDDFRFKGKLDTKIFVETLTEIMESNNIFIDCRPGLSFMQIRNQIWRHLQKGVKVVFIDYLQRMFIENKNDSRATAIQKTVGYLADTAKEFDVAIIILSQLGNVAEGHMATLANLKESGGIAENVSTIILMNNEDRIKNHFKPEEKTHRIFMTVDQRDGEGGMVTLQTKLEYNEFYEESSIYGNLCL